MAAFGFFIGTVLLIYVLSWAVERLACQRLFDDPLKGKIVSVAGAWLIAGTIAGFGMADGGPFRWIAYPNYLPAALLLGAIGWRRGMQLRHDIAATGA